MNKYLLIKISKSKPNKYRQKIVPKESLVFFYFMSFNHTNNYYYFCWIGSKTEEFTYISNCFYNHATIDYQCLVKRFKKMVAEKNEPLLSFFWKKWTLAKLLNSFFSDIFIHWHRKYISYVFFRKHSACFCPTFI